MTYLIRFLNTTSVDNSLVIADNLPQEQAVSFALSLHQASNVPHIVAVYPEDMSEHIVYLVARPDEK